MITRIPKYIMTVAVISVAIVAFFAENAHPATVTWSGANGANWTSPTNWVGGSAPLVSDTAVINSGAVSGAHVVGSAVSNTETRVGTTSTGGSLTISGGGVVNTGLGYIGQTSGSSGTLLVTGAGSRWNGSNTLFVGNSGSGVLTIAAGGVVSTTSGRIAQGTGTSGTVLITGTGSVWQMSTNLLVGTSGQGVLTIENGAGLATNGLTVGTNTTGSGTVVLRGAGSFLEDRAAIAVGSQGSGLLIATNGAVISSSAITFGSNSSGSATAVLSSATLINTGSVIVANSGTAYVSIISNSLINNGAHTYIGFNSGSSGTLSIRNSEWNTNSIGIGRRGYGSMIVDAESIVSSSFDVSIGYLDSGQGLFGAYNNSSVYVDKFLNIGILSTSSGTLIIDGSGTVVRNGLDLNVGVYGNGTLTAASSGTVATGGRFIIAAEAGSSGTVNIGAARGASAVAPGYISASRIEFGAGSGSIAFNHTSTDYMFFSDIAGAGAINVVNGKTTLMGSLADFSGTTNILGGELNYAPGSDGIWAGAISGAGNLAFASGKTILTGNSSGFAGTTTVGSGSTVSVNGQLGGTVQANAGGRLQGSGSVQNASILNGGTLAPGNSIGTLTVSGNLAFAPAAIYEVEIDNTGASDRTNVGGTAELTGATVDVIAAPGTYRVGTSYTILTAGGGLSGTFAGLTQNLNSIFIDPTLSYHANAVFLNLAQSASLTSVARTPNQLAVAEVLERQGAGGALFDAASQFSDADMARAGNDALSGELHATTRNALIEGQSNLRDVPLNRLGGREQGAWAQAFGSWRRHDGDENISSGTTRQQGMLMGQDAAVGTGATAGYTVGYSKLDISPRDRPASASADAFHAGGYYGARPIPTPGGDLALRVGGNMTIVNVSSRRSVLLPNLQESEAAGYGSQIAQTYAEAAYTPEGLNDVFEPFAQMAYLYQHTSGFDEAGGAAALSVQGEQDQYLISTLGLRVSGDMVKGMLGWRHVAGDTSAKARSTLASGGSFTSEGTSLTRDALVYSLGLEWAKWDNLSLNINYGGEVAGDAFSNALGGALTYSW